MLPGTARRLVAEATPELDRDVVRTAQLLTSEIVTNALRDGEARSVCLWLILTGEGLWVEVGETLDVRRTPWMPDQLDERGLD